SDDPKQMSRTRCSTERWLLIRDCCQLNRAGARPYSCLPSRRSTPRKARASASGVAAVGVEDVPGVEIRCLGGKEEQRPGEIGRLTEPALGHAGEKPLAHRVSAFGVLEHPLRQWRAENRGTERVHGDASLAPFAAERLGDAVDGRFRGAIGGVAGGMA